MVARPPPRSSPGWARSARARSTSCTTARLTRRTTRHAPRRRPPTPARPSHGMSSWRRTSGPCRVGTGRNTRSPPWSTTAASVRAASPAPPPAMTTATSTTTLESPQARARGSPRSHTRTISTAISWGAQTRVSARRLRRTASPATSPTSRPRPRARGYSPATCPAARPERRPRASGTDDVGRCDLEPGSRVHKPGTARDTAHRRHRSGTSMCRRVLDQGDGAAPESAADQAGAVAAGDLPGGRHHGVDALGAGLVVVTQRFVALVDQPAERRGITTSQRGDRSVTSARLAGDVPGTRLKLHGELVPALADPLAAPHTEHGAHSLRRLPAEPVVVASDIMALPAGGDEHPDPRPWPGHRALCPVSAVEEEHWAGEAVHDRSLVHVTAGHAHDVALRGNRRRNELISGDPSADQPEHRDQAGGDDRSRRPQPGRSWKVAGDCHLQRGQRDAPPSQSHGSREDPVADVPLHRRVRPLHPQPLAHHPPVAIG